MSQALQCYIGGLPTQKLAKIQLTIMCELAGPQHREIGTPISTGNASWRGPNIEKLEHQFQQAMQVGGAPTLRNWNTNFNRQCKLAGPQHREIGTPISTGNASWGETEINFAKISFCLTPFIISVPIP